MSSTSGCPHADILWCPLYVEAHVTDGFGCDDGGLADGKCAVARGLDYDKAVARLRRAKPQVVAECEFRREADQARAQRNRNMRLAGLH